eukprot:scaffold56688_cov69-Cyclotella_meneghiniana.AAC.1
MKQPVLTEKTTSQTIHSDGTKTSTTVILETIPAASPSQQEERIETTTVVKEFVIEKELTSIDGNKIQVEEVTETTITKKKIHFKSKHNDNIANGWGGMLCGDSAVTREEECDHDEELTMDSALNLDVFGGKTVNSNDTPKNADTNHQGRPSALSMFTSPSAFFRKTHPVSDQSSPIENEKSAPVKQITHVDAVAVRKKKAINLDEEILNIVKKDNGKDICKPVSTSSAADKGASKTISPSQQIEQTQSRQVANYQCIDQEERQESEARQSTVSRSSPTPTQGRPSRGVRTPSPNPNAASTIEPKSTIVLPSTPSGRQSHTPCITPHAPTLTKSSSNRSSSKSKRKEAMKATVPKHKQSLLPVDSDFASPKLTLSASAAAVSDDQFLHFFSYQPNQSQIWRKSTTVAIENTYCMNVSIHCNTAVVGVPYDRNSKGLLTGAAYIFERDGNKDIWTQVKKIVPKDATEFATVGYSVGVHGDMIAVSVPNVGSNHQVGGTVRIYRRVQKYKWSDKGALVPPSSMQFTNAGVATAGKNNVQITTVNKKAKGASNKKKFGTKVAVQGNVVVVSDHYDHNETCVYVFEYDDFSLKWVCIQNDLLSKAQQRHFGSRLALTSSGNGILIGCHAKMSPTEILYYSRYGRGGKFHLQQVIVISKRSTTHGVGRAAVGKNGVTEDITDFKVDGKNLMIGTASSVGQQNQQCVYIYQLQDNDTWILMAKVNDPSLPGFGQYVGLAGNRAMIASRGNAYCYTLDSLIPKASRKQFLTTANITVDEKKKKKQNITQPRYNEPQYLELPYVGADLNDFRTQQQIALHSSQFTRVPTNSYGVIGRENPSQISSPNAQSRMALSMSRPMAASPKKSRWPSPILSRIKGTAQKRNSSAPPLRAETRW